ncbi:MAG: ABC transporter permease [Spirochaetales bacterium]|nr:ABC transporter permease [Spirochaetales bacterium]
MSAIPYLVKKEFSQIRRDRRMLMIIFISPIMQLLILGYAANLDVKNVPLAVYDQDKTPQSRELITELVVSGYFRTDYYVDNFISLERLIDSGKASIALTIPRGFEKKILSGGKSNLSLIVDGSETNSATVGMNYAVLIIGRFSQNIAVRRMQRLTNGADTTFRIIPEMRVWFNPELQSRRFMVPGILGMLLLVMTMLLTSLAIVREKEIGTLEQLIVTPIKPPELILGKLLPFIIIGFIDVLLVIFAASFFFGIVVKGNLFLLLFLTGIFLMSTLGLGLFISTVSQTQQQAMMTTIFFVIMPFIILSGFVFPIENMPKIIQYLTLIFPLRYYYVIIRGLFLKGVGLSVLWPEALILFIQGAVILSFSILRFRKRVG